jgi:hypothetical protein
MHTLHLHVPLTRRTKDRSLAAFQKQCCFGNRGALDRNVDCLADLIAGDVTNNLHLFSASPSLSFLSVSRSGYIRLKEFTLDVPPQHFKIDQIRRYDREKKALHSRAITEFCRVQMEKSPSATPWPVTGDICVLCITFKHVKQKVMQDRLVLKTYKVNANNNLEFLPIFKWMKIMNIWNTTNVLRSPLWTANPTQPHWLR